MPYKNRISAFVSGLALAALLAVAPASQAATWLKIFQNDASDFYMLDIDAIEKLPGQKLRVWIKRLAAKPTYLGLARPVSMAYEHVYIDCRDSSYRAVGMMFYDAEGRLLEKQDFADPPAILLSSRPGTSGEVYVSVACQRAYGKPPTAIPVDPRIRTAAGWTLLSSANGSSTFFADAQVRTFKERAPNYVIYPLRIDWETPVAAAGGMQISSSVMLYSTDCTDLNSLQLSAAWFDRGVTQLYREDTDLDGRTGAAPAAPGKGSVMEVAAMRACAVGYGGRLNAAAPRRPAESAPVPETVTGSGTGWHVGNGLIVTAAHVISDAKSISVIGQDNIKLPASVIEVDQKNDVAVISIGTAGHGMRAVALAHAPAALGSHVMTIGYPLLPTLGTAPKVTSGEISSTQGLRNDPTHYQISAPIQPGNSGGPLFNMYGEVVGMVVSKLNAKTMLAESGALPENINYAVKTRYIEVLLEEANRGALPPRASPPRRELRAEDLVSQNRDAVFIVYVTGIPAK